jgi:hypothetical protein
MRRYYAVSYAYGPQVLNNGNVADMLVGFASAKERDAWVTGGADYQGPDWREAMTRREAERHAARNVTAYWEYGADGFTEAPLPF